MNNSHGSPAVNSECAIVLRPYQQKAVDDTLAFLRQSTGNPIVALPTGTGKSVIIAELVRQANLRVVVLTHSRTLVEQDEKKLRAMVPFIDSGIFCAGLGEKSTGNGIIFATIQSLANSKNALGHRDLIIVDECHRINEKNAKTQYMQVSEQYPDARWIGLTATPWRDTGPMIPGLFTDFSVDMTSFEGFNSLLKDGYLAPVVPRKTNTTIDTSKVQKLGANADFVESELAKVVDVEDVNEAISEEIATAGADRKKLLIFAVTIAHAEHLCSRLVGRGIAADIVHSNRSIDDNDRVLAAYKTGDLRAIVNVGCLTTGFDCPQTDLIAVARPTRSSSLWVQMLGRGTRPANGKKDCLVLDFGSCTLTCGPINDPYIPDPKQPNKKASPSKICPACRAFIPLGSTVCPACGFDMPRPTPTASLAPKASEMDLLRTDSKAEGERVMSIHYYPYTSLAGNRMMRVDYTIEFRRRPLTEFVWTEATDWRRIEARRWFKIRGHDRIVLPRIEAACELAKTLRQPAKVRVVPNAKNPAFPTITPMFEV